MKQLLYIDLFCGAGGTSTGVNSARVDGEQCAEVIACVNHDAKAIASHASNHPDALHFTEDIRTLELSPLVAHLDKCRRENPEALTVLWASLECTNFSKQFSGAPDDKNISVDGPAGTITTIDHHAFVSVHYGNGFNTSVEAPAATLTTHDRMALVQTNFLDMQYGNSKPSSVESVAGTVTTNPKHHLVTVKPWLMDTNFANVGSSIDEPSRVITANRKHHYLMNPQFTSSGGSVDSPCFTLIARMDKMPPYLIATESGQIAIEIYESDSPMTVKIKEFMALYGIVDIKMRMLKIQELKLIMGFPEDYVLIGTQADQKKFIGNAVEVTIARAWCAALCSAVKRLKRKTA